jgi:hypothetical protein
MATNHEVGSSNLSGRAMNRKAPLVWGLFIHGIRSDNNSRREFDKNRMDAIFGQRQLARTRADPWTDQAQSLRVPAPLHSGTLAARTNFPSCKARKM